MIDFMMNYIFKPSYHKGTQSISIGSAFTLLLLIISSCSSPNQSSTRDSIEKVVSLATGSLILDRALEAHGGLTKWNSYGSMSFTKTSGDKSERQLIDLYNRNVLIEGDSFKLGFDGKSMWIAPDKDSFGKGNPKFYHNLWFYFGSLPFVLADSGNIVKDLPSRSVNKISYDCVSVTFEEGVGDSPEDEYILYLDQKTGLIHMINYSVTFYDKSRAKNYNALVYDEWHEVDGLQMPQKLTGYKWVNDSLGDVRYNVELSNYSFLKQQPSMERFTAPKLPVYLVTD
ncbi:MAG: hypothetical protein ACJAZM_000309 [Cyclobacteriaceae bacterium]|jgi:hypothetical protein